MKDIIRQLIREELGKTNKTFYFIAGLPRAGSTLLSSLLNQNPQFYSGPASPILPAIVNTESFFIKDELYAAYPRPQAVRALISTFLTTFYQDVDKPVVFDKNRGWTSNTPYIRGYFGIENPKIICPVRDIADILASFITLIQADPISAEGRLNFVDEILVKTNTPLTVENRCKMLASNIGVLGQAYDSLKSSLLEGNEKTILLVEYEDLVESPKKTLESIYEFIEQPWFEHEFSSITNQHPTNAGSVYGLSNLHLVRETISRQHRIASKILPESIIEGCAGAEFWREAQEQEGSNLVQ